MTFIQWANEMWNPIAGCSKISSGCKNCYAINHANRLVRNPNPKISSKYAETVNDGNWTGKLNLASVDTLFKPLYWTRPRMVFVNSMSDLFHESVPDEWIDMIFAVMALSPTHTFQVLTKRPKRMYDYFKFADNGVFSDRLQDAVFLMNLGKKASSDVFNTAYDSFPLNNVWLGCSVEDQKSANDRIHWLLRTPAWVRWISAEPVLEKIRLSKLQTITSSRINALTGECLNWDDEGKLLTDNDGNIPMLNSLDWVVIGGESGKDARITNLEFIREIVLDCKAEKVPVFVKQLGKWCYDNALWNLSHIPSKGIKNSKKIHPFFNFTDEKGGNINDFPSDLRFREFPK